MTAGPVLRAELGLALNGSRLCKAGASYAGMDRVQAERRVGFKQNEEYVHEWTGEVAGEGDVGKAIGNALADYRNKSGKAIWGMSIMVDKARPQ